MSHESWSFFRTPSTKIMKLSALYVVAICAAAGYAQDTFITTSTSYNPSAVSSGSSAAKSSLSSLYSSLSSEQSSLTAVKSSLYSSYASSIRSSISSVASDASKSQLNPTATPASAGMAVASGSGVFMGIVAGLLTAFF